MSKTVRFRIGRRIRVTDHGSHPEMNGRVGTVVQIRRTSEAAWIAFDDDLPKGCHTYAAADPNGRGRHAMIYFDECEELR